MRKLFLILPIILLAGCASKPAYELQTNNATAANSAIAAQVVTLGQDVKKQCDTKVFDARFATIKTQLDVNKGQIASISTACKAEISRYEEKINARNILIGAILTIIGGYIFIRIKYGNRK